MKASDLSPEVRARLGIGAPASKYKVRAKDTRTADGIVFDSKAEMRRYRELLLMNAMERVKYFLRQVPFHLPGGVVYRCDFMVVYADGSIEFEDVKGMRTKEYVMKKRMVEAIYPVKIREVVMR